MSEAQAAARAFPVFRKPEDPRRTLFFLLGPCIIYLVCFSIYPLIYSLSLSFTDMDAAGGGGNCFGSAARKTMRCGARRNNQSPA